jgi:hypothetical protein
VTLEHRKNGQQFPVSSANHQLIVSGRISITRLRQQMAAAAPLRKYSANKKAGTRPAFSLIEF